MQPDNGFLLRKGRARGGKHLERQGFRVYTRAHGSMESEGVIAGGISCSAIFHCRVALGRHGAMGRFGQSWRPCKVLGWR